MSWPRSPELAPDTVHLQLAERHHELLVAYARAAAPRECCGLLLGRGLTVTGLWPCRNVATGEHGFMVHPDDQLLGLQVAYETDEFDVIGMYHSHPRGPGWPSPADLVCPPPRGWHYVVVSLAGPAPTVSGFLVS